MAVVRRGWGWICSLSNTTPGLIFLFFACLYLLTSQGRVNAYDGQSMFATAKALADHGSLAITRSLGVPGRDGLHYAKYGIGLSLAELPLYLLGKMLGVFAGAKGAQFAEMLAMLTNPLLMALTCTLSYAIFRALGYARVTAVRATFVLGIATSLWPYSKVDFSEPLLTFCLAAAVACVLRAAQAETQGDLARVLRLDALAGAALGGAILTKYAAVIYLPVFVLYVSLTLPQPFSVVRWLTRQAALVGPIIVAGCFDLLVNVLRFGSPLTTGYAPDDRPFTGTLTRGLWGLFISPYRGILFYDPILFVGLLCLPLLLWRRPREAVLPVGLLLVSLALYGTYSAWDAGSGWGPRYLIPVLPYLLWPLLGLGIFGPKEGEQPIGAGAAGKAPSALARLRRIGLAVGVSLAATIQALGVLVNPLIYVTYWSEATHPIIALKTNILASPMATAIWALPLSLRYAFTHTFPAHGYASADYAFGPPFPTHADMPQALGGFYAQYFWWTLLPHSALACAVGVVVLGTGMVLAIRGLVQRLRRTPATKWLTAEATPLQER